MRKSYCGNSPQVSPMESNVFISTKTWGFDNFWTHVMVAGEWGHHNPHSVYEVLELRPGENQFLLVVRTRTFVTPLDGAVSLDDQHGNCSYIGFTQVGQSYTESFGGEHIESPHSAFLRGIEECRTEKMVFRGFREDGMPLFETATIEKIPAVYL